MSLTFAFNDLDLSGWNDPTGFLESVQFFSASNVALSGIISSKDSSGGGTLAYTITGNPQTACLRPLAFVHA